jgi:hypothetical protein
MRKLANIARRVFGNSVQASYFERFHWPTLNFWTLQTEAYFERFHWSILNFRTLQTAEHAASVCSVQKFKIG